MDVRDLNRTAWDRLVDRGIRWSIPVGAESITAARNGEWEIYLTPTRPIPKAWLPTVAGKQILCLASGGGQQGPILAAAGAVVTVLDNSPCQLHQDRLVAEREGLRIETVEGTMKDLSPFAANRFDYIVHPVSNCFVDDVRPVWNEAYRVLRPGGALLSGFNNPDIYLFDVEVMASAGKLEARNRLPYSDLERLDAEQRSSKAEQGVPMEFSHTLELQIGGQMEAGFTLIGLYEDRDLPGENALINQYLRPYIATRAVKHSVSP